MHLKPSYILLFLLAILFAGCRKARKDALPRLEADIIGTSDTLPLGLTACDGAERIDVYYSDGYVNNVLLTYFKGRYYCMWQQSERDEDSPDTAIRYATSTDGKQWSVPAVLAAPEGDSFASPGGWMQQGDTLTALINYIGPADSPTGTRVAYICTTDGANWTTPAPVLMDDGEPLFGIFEQDPLHLPDGRMVGAAHFQPGKKLIPLYTDDPTGVGGWKKARFPEGEGLPLEPSQYLASDGRLVMFMRDQDASFVKLVSFSDDRGESWSAPRKTAIPDSRSKQCAGTLPDGCTFWVGNPTGSKSRRALVLALSRGGYLYDEAFLLAGPQDLPARRKEGRYKTPGYNYPKAYMVGDTLWISFSVNKEDASLIKIIHSAAGPQHKLHLPEVLVRADGKPVRTAAQWEKKRRAEVLEMFSREMYGHVPGRPEGLHFEVLSSEPAFDGLAIRKTVRFWLDAAGEHSFDVLIHLPAGADGPVPMFAGLNFKGNDATLDERASSRWPYELVLKAGWGVATAWRDAIEPDVAQGAEGGVRSWYNAGGDWGAISAWAWGLSRILDYLETDPAADASRVVVIGHSRLGKTALWAAANDERFAGTVSNDSGCCGAAISRRRVGETFQDIDTAFPHWFTRAFDQYKGREEDFPGDQHWLLALSAPRPLYVASATEDTWADPVGEWLSAWEAGAVYALFGLKGLGKRYPAPDTPDASGTVAYHVRTGAHDITAWDWAQYIAFFGKRIN